jgi:hypothetical protein
MCTQQANGIELSPDGFGLQGDLNLYLGGLAISVDRNVNEKFDQQLLVALESSAFRPRSGHKD